MYLIIQWLVFHQSLVTEQAIMLTPSRARLLLLLQVSDRRVPAENAPLAFQAFRPGLGGTGAAGQALPVTANEQVLPV